jgi:hypothetical protein
MSILSNFGRGGGENDNLAGKVAQVAPSLTRALTYMGTVKQRFIASSPETYHEFIQFMTRYVHKKMKLYVYPRWWTW